MNTHTTNLVSTDWLKEHLNDSNLVILDATMKKKPNGDSIPEALIRIPGSQVFNFDTQICDQQSDLPHMLCSAEEFEIAAKNLGISQNSKIVVYDMMGIFSSPRAWWMFKVMGHSEVFVLNGGLPKWLEAGHPTESSTRKNDSFELGNFQANFSSENVFDVNQVLENINNKHYQILDARSKARFFAKEDEPRASLKRGHIPGSLCLPFTELLQRGLLKNKAELQAIFSLLVKSTSRQLIFSCGSGVTACILALAAAECGYSDCIVYDGSWNEWGRSDSLPIER